MSKFSYFPKDKTKTGYGRCGPEDINMLGNELINTINSANLTPSMNETDQLAKSISNYVAKGTFCKDITTDYAHINLQIQSPFKAPNTYYDGMIITFLPMNINLANATVNVNGLGEKPIREKIDKEGIAVGVIAQNQYIQLIYNQSLDSFIIFQTQNQGEDKPKDIGTGRLLLEPIWMPRIIEDKGFLRSDTFNWYDGVEYKQAINHLWTDIQNKTPTSETVAGININCILADDGDKIILADDTETLANLETLYTNTGIAWYYILDIENTRFKLPRSQWNFVGLRPDGSVGEYVEESLPNITGSVSPVSWDFAEQGVTTGAFAKIGGNTKYDTNNWTGGNGGTNFNASRSSSAYQDGASVQQRATQMILYFYAGGDEVEPKETIIRNRNIGEIFTTIFPVNDNGVVRLFGQELDMYVDTYKDFYQVLKQLKSQGTCPNLFCTETEWQDFYTQHSFCPKFVVDEERNTVRMPLLKGYCKNISSLEDLGKINEAGLPNITGSYPLGLADQSAAKYTGAFFANTSTNIGGKSQLAGLSSNSYSYASEFDASRSSSVYKDGLNTIEVDGYNALVYLVVANSTEEKVSVIEDYEINNTVPLTCPVYAPNLFQDINYLLSDNQWHSGEIYEAVWNLLTAQYNDESSVEITKTLSDGTSLTLKKTPLDYLICKIDENNTEEKINRFYNEIRFTCWVINTTTNEFKLPQNTQRALVESYKDDNGNWYNLYSDGWVEQGGMIGGSYSSNANINFLIPFTNTKYNVNFSNFSTETGAIANKRNICINGYTSTGISFVSNQYVECWEAKGYANTSALNNQFNFSNYLYFKVGNTTVGAELVYANKVLTELDKKANLSLDNINDIAKQSIVATAWGGLQTTDETKVGYVLLFKDNDTAPTNSKYTLPEGGTWFVNISCVMSNGTFLGLGSGGRIVAGGTSITVDSRTSKIFGFAIKIQ